MTKLIHNKNSYNLVINLLFIYLLFNCLLIWSGLNPFLLTISIITTTIVISMFLYILYKNVKTPIMGKRILWIYCFWIIITAFRGFLMLDSKRTISMFTFGLSGTLMISFIFVFQDIKFIKVFFYKYFKYAIPFFLLVSPLMLKGCWGWFLTPILLLVIFYSNLSNKWKIITIALFIMAVLDPDTRSNLIRGMAALGTFLLLKFKRFQYYTLLCKSISFIFLIAPIILLFLGLSGTFNIFEIRQDDDDEMYADTRTNVYQEVITSSINNNYAWQGRTFSKGYDSVFQEQFFILTRGAVDRNSEVSVCNIYTWMGLIGFTLYFLLFITCVYYSIFKSNNVYIKALGVYLSTRWLMAFIEDINNVDPLNITIFLVMSICLNSQFLSMNNKEFMIVFKDLFTTKRRRWIGTNE